MGTNCAPLVADFFLFCYERYFMLSLSDNNQTDIIEAFNLTSRYLDDLLNIDNPYFEQMVGQIYPTELQLNKANSSDTEAPFLDLYLSITNGIVSSKIYDKRDDFNFEIVNFPFLDGDVPHSPPYGVYISQLIRFARVCSNVDDFNNRNLFLTAKLLKQGYRYHKIHKAFSKFYHRHSELIVKYNVGLKTLLKQGISEPIFYGDLVYKFKRIVGKPNFSYERYFILSLSDNNQTGIIEAFNSTSRYLDDLLNIDNPYFEQMVGQIYPTELQLNKANSSDTEAPFLDLNLSITNGIVSSKIYDKRDDFNFEIVNFPFFDGDVPHSHPYGVYISQLIRFARVCSNVDDFNNRNLFLTAKLLKQGYRYHKIRKAFSKFYHRHSELIVKYNIGLKTLLKQGISEPLFYGDLVYKFKRIVGKPNFSDQFKKIVKRYTHPGSGSDRTSASERQNTAFATLYIGGSVTCSKKKTQGA